MNLLPLKLIMIDLASLCSLPMYVNTFLCKPNKLAGGEAVHNIYVNLRVSIDSQELTNVL